MCRRVVSGVVLGSFLCHQTQSDLLTYGFSIYVCARVTLW